jgi:NAD-dependent dihydropyrimidine dehydrogenase PreA subunit
MLDEQRTAAFIRLFDVPPAAVPYLPLMFAESEIALVLSASDGPIDVAAATERLGVQAEEARAALEGAFRRGVFNRAPEEGRYLYTPTDFYTRMDYFATFEDWEAVPADVRKALDEWMLARYAESVRPNVERLRAGLAPERSPGNDSVLLLDELDAVIDAAHTIAVLPCNCRRIAGNCGRPLEVCLHFDARAEDKLARGYGKRLTVADAKALVRWADRKGLMHTTDLNWGDEGPAPICNCCADDCYVFRASAMLQSKDAWPRTRYVAVYDQEACNRCGICVRSCHFGAFQQAGQAERRPRSERAIVTFNPATCWGCGLCANTCPAGAISMRSLVDYTGQR